MAIKNQTGAAVYKRILVAIDGSSTSKRALREAVKLAQEGQSVLSIVHVVDLVSLNVPETLDKLEAYENALRKSGQQILRHAAVSAEKAGVKYETRLLELTQMGERIADKLSREAKDWRAELIVVGTHGRRGVSRLFLGSVAESVIRVASVPVLLIRGR